MPLPFTSIRQVAEKTGLSDTCPHARNLAPSIPVGDDRPLHSLSFRWIYS